MSAWQHKAVCNRHDDKKLHRRETLTWSSTTRVTTGSAGITPSAVRPARAGDADTSESAPQQRNGLGVRVAAFGLLASRPAPSLPRGTVAQAAAGSTECGVTTNVGFGRCVDCRPTWPRCGHTLRSSLLRRTHHDGDKGQQHVHGRHRRQRAQRTGFVRSEKRLPIEESVGHQ